MGKKLVETNATSSYDDMVAAFGQPVSSTDSANPGDGVNVWVTDNGDIMAFFHNNVLTDITFRLKEGDANHQSTGSHFQIRYTKNGPRASRKTLCHYAF